MKLLTAAKTKALFYMRPLTLSPSTIIALTLKAQAERNCMNLLMIMTHFIPQTRQASGKIVS